jgi:hypothetical protein
MATKKTPLTAPVQGFPPGIPWALHLEAYSAYCKVYPPQLALIDFEGRNCRGGFDVQELDLFIPGWRERISTLNNDEANLPGIRRLGDLT